MLVCKLYILYVKLNCFRIVISCTYNEIISIKYDLNYHDILLSVVIYQKSGISFGGWKHSPIRTSLGLSVNARYSLTEKPKEYSPKTKVLVSSLVCHSFFINYENFLLFLKNYCANFLHAPLPITRHVHV